MGRVALIGENSVEYIEKVIDIWNVGDSVVLIDWRIPYHSMIQMMKEANVYKCYIESSKYTNQEFGEIEVVTYDLSNKRDRCLPSLIYEKFYENYSKKEAVVIYSSGTTGRSKGIILSHFAINKNADAIIDYMKPYKDDCIYIIKALSHSSAFIGELLVALKMKVRLIVSPTIVMPRYILKNIEKHNVSIVCLNPMQLSLILKEYLRNKYNLSFLKTIYVSGDILSDNLYHYATNTFKNIEIYNVYGLTEAGPRVAAQRKECCRYNSVGKPVKGVNIILLDETGREVECGEIGIVHIKTECLFDGYILGENNNVSVYKEWFNTGDIGVFFENKELAILGRVDDVIVLESHKIYPNEIEQKIIEYASIEECIVLKMNNKKNDFLICIYTGEHIVENDIKSKLRKVLLPYEIPRHFIKSKMIPKTLNGKLSKKELKETIDNILEVYNNE